MAERHNNPLNIKRGRATEYLVKNGTATVGEAASDEGNFLKFKNPRDGMDAATRLLVGPLYNGLSVDAALRKWSNGGYGGALAEQVGIDPTLRIRDLSPNQISTLTQAMANAESGKPVAPSAPAEAKKSPFGSTEVISPGGIAEIPKGERLSIPNVIFTPTPETRIAPPGKEPAPAPARKRPSGTAEAATPPATTPAQIADLLDLPFVNEPTATRSVSEPASISVDIEKVSPQATPTPAEVRAVRRMYDLRGLDPDEIDAVVGRALEAKRISAAASAAKTQLLETDEGYVLIDKSTGQQVPLTREGKVDTKRLLADDRTSKLSTFSQDMSAPDYRIRGKMNDTQAKALEFGSRALQANERQRRLELKFDDPTVFANKRTHILSVLESLGPETPMNVVSTIVGAVSAGPDVLKGELDALDAAGLGPAAQRVLAAMKARGKLTEDERDYLANALEFSTAMLRRESGAAINAGEFLSTYRLYFPTVGDTQRDVLRKMRTRQQAIRGLRSSAGRPLLVPDVED